MEYDMTCVRVEVIETTYEHGRPFPIPVRSQSTLTSSYGEFKIEGRLELGRLYRIKIEDMAEHESLE